MILSIDEYIPRAPDDFLKAQYRTKGITITVGSIVTCISLTNAILNFDLISFMTYVFTVVISIVFGIITMKNNETYWTEEFYQYALYVKEKSDGNKQLDSGEQECIDTRLACTTDDNSGQSGV